MANSDIDIASQAFTLLGADAISSFNDGSNESDIGTQLYSDYVKNLLCSYPWTFATKKARLNQETTPPVNEYTYSHILPAEALLVWTVFDSSQVGASPIRDYDIYAGEGTRRIYSNYADLWADYTVYTSEANWLPYFTQFAVNALAAHFAMPLTQNIQLADYYDKIAFGGVSSNRKGGLYGMATATDSKQKRNETIISSPFTEARFA